MTATEAEIQALDRSLTNQAPMGRPVVTRFENLRGPAKHFGVAILNMVPPSRERSLAITKLEEALMWAIKGIALNQDKVLEEEGG